jgi:preprotein translocase subunit SecB
VSQPSKPLQTLSDNAVLSRVYYLEVSARQADPDSHEDAPTPGFELNIETSQDDGRFRIKLRVSASSDSASLAVEPVAEFQVPEDVRNLLVPENLVEFANEVGVMVLLPYVREAVADVTRRVFGTPSLVPLIQRGQLRFSLDPPE